MSNLRLTKRDFLKYGTSLMTAAALPYPYQAALAKEQWDAIVIGAGTAGIPAAISAAERGLKVLVIEKASVIGGTLFVSSGQISGAGTVFQERKGIKDSPDQHYDDIMRLNHNTSDPKTRLQRPEREHAPRHPRGIIYLMAPRRALNSSSASCASAMLAVMSIAVWWHAHLPYAVNE